VEVWREPDLSGSHRIDETGALRHVLLGAVPAGGLTCEALGERLSARLEEDYLRKARVVVTLERSARSKAWVLGSVVTPGAYPVADGTRVLDLVFAAGGLGTGSDGSATLYRMGGAGAGDPAAPDGREALDEVELDLAALFAGDLAANLEVAAGDLIVVSGAPGAVGSAGPVGRVRVVGEVEKPGAYLLSDAPTALDAVLAAGGFTEYASQNRARLVRGDGDERTERRLRFLDVLRGRKGAENPALEDGDLIVVPETFF
jgi:polysaccharide export outer membrane protein